MDLRTALSAWAGAGAAENARRSLHEWDRAQAEVSALLERLGRTQAAEQPDPPLTLRRPGSAA